MAKRVPSERLRRELDEVLAGVVAHEDPVEAVARLGARLIMQQALEDEVSEFLGRERYQRAGEGAAIYRNGYEPKTVKTTSGSMELEHALLEVWRQRRDGTLTLGGYRRAEAGWVSRTP